MKDIKTKIKEYIDNDPDLKQKKDLLDSIPGIGEKTISVIQMLIVGAAMRKLIHIIYGVLKTNRPFDPEWAKRST